MNNTFSILIDSNCDLPPAYLEEHGIDVLPMPFDLDGKIHNLGYWQEISAPDYYGALRNGSIARTSLINVESFTTAFTGYAKQGQDVLLITLSSGLSTTYNNAESAACKVKAANPGCNIYTVDSINASAGHGLLVMLAVQKRGEGLTAGETAAWLEKKKHVCLSLFTVDNLMYLHRGGRLSKLSAITGEILNIKPLLIIGPDGSLKLKDKVRGRKAALKLMVNQLKHSIEHDTILDTVMITHTDCPEDAQTLADIIKTSVQVRQVSIMMMGPVIGAHVGPGTITMTFVADITREEYDSRF